MWKKSRTLKKTSKKINKRLDRLSVRTNLVAFFRLLDKSKVCFHEFKFGLSFLNNIAKDSLT